MLKRSLSLLTLLVCMIPMAAFAGNVSSRVMTSGGSITVGAGPAQTNINGTVTKFYAAATSVVIAPAANYAVSAVTINGVAQALTSPLAVPLLPTLQSVAVSFKKQVMVNVSVAAILPADGSVNLPGTTSQIATSVVNYIFTPAAGKSVVSISGLPSGTQPSPALPSATAVTATFTVPTIPVNIVGSFADTVVIPFNALVQCETCHVAAAVGVGNYAAWNASAHNTATVTCISCHSGAETGVHPGILQQCVTCHNGTTAPVAHNGGFTNCVECHNPHSTIPLTAGTSAAAHAVSGDVAVSNIVMASGTAVTMTFNLKVDGVNNDTYTATPGGYRFAASSPPTVPGPYPIKNDFTRTTAVPAIVSDGSGNYTATWTGTPPTGATTYMITAKTAAGKLATFVGHLNSAARDLTSNTGCFNCHGATAFKSGSHHGANPLTVEACVICHTRATSVSRGAGGDRTTAYVHGIHNSHNMPAGGYDRQFPVKDGVIDFAVGYPTYMTNCSVCHSTPAQLAAITAAPVSYSLCMSCHDTWAGFDHGNTVFGGTEHAAFDWNTDCASCHVGDTTASFHNVLLTERGGVIKDGADLSVIEGAKVDMQITGTSRVANNLVVTWTASYDGAPVNPCNAVAAAGAPVFHAPAANAVTGQAAGGLSLLRAFAIGDDWANEGISTSPGQPASTNLSTSNTACAANVATTTIALTAPEIATAATKAVVAIQGRAQVKLAAAYSGTKDVTLVRSKSPTKEFVPASGAATAQNRRAITGTATCLNCHVGSLYQHGGNRIDNMDLCVMCHNEASSEQNVRLLDGVNSTEASDSKPGQTYGFKSLLHAVHSAGHNDAITMVYRTNGNYIWAADPALIPNYPQFDVYADGNNGRPTGIRGMVNNPFDDDAAKTGPVGHGAAALMYGSSAPHGTGPYTETVAGEPYYQVYRAANLHVTHFPQALNNCAACHLPGTFGLPDPAKAIATTVNAGAVKLGGTVLAPSASHADNSILTDDTVQGPAAAACMSCHATSNTVANLGKTKAWLSNHANGGGFAPAVKGTPINAAENCAACHN